jgi:hypothetical protein
VNKWEADSIHGEIAGIFTRRNSFAHGKVKALGADEFTSKNVARWWDTTLRLLLQLESGPAARIPKSRIDDFEREIDALRVRVP